MALSRTGRPTRPNPPSRTTALSRQVRAALLLAPACLSLAAAAEAPVSAAQEFVERIVVTATREPVLASDAPASVSVVDARDIELKHAARLGDVLSEVPGLYLRNNAGGAHFPSSGQASIALRGIPRTPRTLILIDGQPMNSALSGGIDLASIAFANVERVEVVRGPYSALYGGNAMGGVIQVVTRVPAGRRIEASIESGFGDARGASAQALWQDRFANGLALSLLASVRQSDGWPDSDGVVKAPTTGTGTLAASGAIPTTTAAGVPMAWIGTKGARPWTQKNAELKLNHSSEALGTFAAGLAYSGYRVGYEMPASFLTNAAGQPVLSGNLATNLGRLSVNESDFLTLTPSLERDVRGFIAWSRPLGDTLRLHAHLGRVNSNFRFVQPANSARYEGGSGEWSDQPSERTDADLHASWAASDSLLITFGGSAAHQHLNRRALAAGNWRDFGSTGAENSHGSGTLDNRALFAQAEWRINAAWSAFAGLRYDRYLTEGEVGQNTAPAYTLQYASRGDSQWSPKLAAVFKPSQTLTLRASLGSAFRPPTLLDLYSRTVSPTATAGVVSVNEAAPGLKAERLSAAEAGADWHLARDSSLSVALFAQELKDLIYRSRVSATLTQSVNAGRARVNGIELSFRHAFAGTPFTLAGQLTRLDRYDITANTAIPASVGKRLTDVPGRLGSLTLEWREGAWSAALAARHVAHLYGSGDDTNLNVVQGVYGSYDARTTLHGKLNWQAHPKVRVSLSADNLANRQYFDFYKQPGTTASISLDVRF